MHKLQNPGGEKHTRATVIGNPLKPNGKTAFPGGGENIQASPPLSERWNPWGTIGKPLGKQVIPCATTRH